jgi:tetratricopeptide (TPR) repeat protein
MAERGLGNQETARDLLARSGPVGIQPPDPYLDALQDLVRGERLYLIRGKMAYAAGRLKEAAEAFREAAAADPESARARINLAATIGRLDQHDEAIGQLREALRLDPGNITARFNLAQLLTEAQAFDEAISLLETVVAQEPEDAEAHRVLAEAYRETGRTAEALEHFRKTVRIDSSVEDAWIGGTQLLVDLGRYPEALGVLNTGQVRLPASGRIAHALARLLAGAPDVGLRDGVRARDLAEKVYAARPTPGHAETLAMALAESGDCEGAAEWQAKAADAVGPPTVADAANLQRMRLLESHYRSARPCRYPGAVTPPASTPAEPADR